MQYSATRVIANPEDPIRIVPSHDPNGLFSPTQEAGPSVPPQLTYRGGPLLANVEVFTIFWGSGWNSAPQSGLVNQINGFFQSILSSPLMTQLSEYNTGAWKIGNGQFTGSTSVTHPAPHRTVTDRAIQHMLEQELANNHAFPQPNPNLLYFVYLPPGIAVSQGGARSCQAFCGYHDAISSQIFYAVMPYPNCPGCLGGLQPFDALTGTSSHELCEAITDPVPGTGWYDDNNGEIGDICAWQFKKVGAYNVQKEWSNKQNACV